MNLKQNNSKINRFNSRSEGEDPITLMEDITRLFHDKIEKNPLHNLNNTQRLIIMSISKNEGTSQLDLVNTTKLKPPTVSVTLQKLEKDGIVYRIRNEFDLREAKVYLTEKGKNINLKLRETINEEEELLLSCFSEEENTILLSLLKKMRNGIIERIYNI